MTEVLCPFNVTMRTLVSDYLVSQLMRSAKEITVKALSSIRRQCQQSNHCEWISQGKIASLSKIFEFTLHGIVNKFKQTELYVCSRDFKL